MFNKYMNTLYDEVELGKDLAECIADLAFSDELILRVIEEIAKRDRTLLNYKNQGVIDKDRVYGVTKEEIRQSIVTGKKVVNQGEKVDTYPAIKKIDSIIAFLMGATLVYYERCMNKQKRYLFTSRAIEVIMVLKERGCLSIEALVNQRQ